MPAKADGKNKSFRAFRLRSAESLRLSVGRRRNTPDCHVPFYITKSTRSLKVDYFTKLLYYIFIILSRVTFRCYIQSTDKSVNCRHN